ncbi:MAG: cytochrome c biogenesis protein CcsA [Leeuwenhoekiella sp.]|jgi:cytochrome c-type biogenesis protein CcsB|uniref:cytochrome c biogenesis protein CcsA n=1 Tax=Leeuwenhoekiella TaxID=283735 RepID=UPI000C5E719A|nr:MULTISPECIES: cytochrome c biogenesis protein CcsA [Leeuwenhoekiella]MAO45069.1 cytochrome C biogenesis protein [Leeuwenhoekiella sp.]MBQ51008.1 cytochrome C biogenesis protein [Leeuwenhoekiella sp.]|tara:strand:- start:232 stop:3477 length:3246 start_codon:yes stop_codon:yes gene_type:complete
MQKRIADFLFSTRLMAVLFIVYAVAMATGTILDAGQETSPTPYTRELVYEVWWFELIHILFIINFIGNIWTFRLWRKEKWSTLVFHAAFILIIFGAAWTRYVGFEGVMPIREGETQNTFLTEKTYLNVFIDGERDGAPMRRKLEPKRLNLSTRLDNNFTWETDFDGKPVSISFSKFIDGAEEGLIESTDGKSQLKIVEAGDGQRHEHYLEDGTVASIHNMLFALNKPTEGAINIGYDGENYTINTPFEGSTRVMATQTDYEVAKDSVQELKLRALYQLGGMQFVIPDPVIKGKNGIVEAFPKQKGQQDALFVTITTAGGQETVGLLGGKGFNNEMVSTDVGDLKFHMAYGSLAEELPFSIKLKDFIAERYPGTTNAYSSYESKVTVIDGPQQSFDYDIYMNHVLDHQGYRFFQASFDPDELGTVLSVNHDMVGTWITYIGYFLLYLGLMIILFDKGSRFGDLKVRLDKVKARKAKLSAVIALIVFSGMQLQAQEQEVIVENGNTEIVEEQPEDFIPGSATVVEEQQHTLPTAQQIDSMLTANKVPAEEAAKFGKLVIQDDGGRMMPVNTFSSKLLRKLSRSDTYEGLTADQVFLSMVETPFFWYNVDLIYVKPANDSLRGIIGVPKEQKYLSALDFIDDMGRNKLDPYITAAYQAEVKNSFDKDFIDIAERLGLLNRAVSGEILKIFPLINDENNKWVSYPELNESGYKGMDSLYTKQILPLYFSALREGKETGDFSKADTFLNSIKSFQEKYGSEVMPSQNKIDAEVFYNKHDIFTKLYWMYLLASIVMFVFVIIRIFKDNRFIKTMVRLSGLAVGILFALHTAGLIWRWYISGHAPWSDAYESILYVGWATMFFGLAFGRKSSLTIASTAFVAGFILWGASMNWLNPAISNLQPVLDSYWLMIHVAVIVASYGPFTLGMILGIVSLLLMLLTNSKNKKRMDLNIKELTIINEMALTVGLVMLTIGNFLGGQWANESWGRYWGWDPKETWALISIMVYAFVIHMRLVPGLRGRWFFNLMSILAYGSILMTYFGVNFWLSGLHSYASGDNILNLNKAIGIFAGVIIFALIAYPKYKKFYKK